MIILAALILCYMMVLLGGRIARRVNFLGYVFVMIFTVLQVLFLLGYLYTMEVPVP